jgi:ribose transport system ATP-binding protein
MTVVAFLEVRGIVQRFPGVVALNGVDMSVELGRVHVLAGENGAGKSTLVKILVGTQVPTEGTILIDGQKPFEHPHLFDYVAYVPQEINLFAHMTVAENLFIPFGKSGSARWVLDHGRMFSAAQEFIERFHISARPGQLVKDIPISDQQLLQIARAAARQRFQVLILDEPTSSLTSQEVERLFRIIRQLRASNHAVIFISHKMEEIFDLGDEVSVLRNGELVGHRPLAGLGEPELIRMMSGEEIRMDQVFYPECEVGPTMVQVEGLSGHHFNDISFTLRQGEILGFAGLVGAGRSELMQTLFGYLKASAGRVKVMGQKWRLGDPSFAIDHGIFYLSEERRRHGILPFESVRENIGISIFDRTVRAGVISAERERGIVADVIATYDIKTPSMDRQIMFLSGGNQQKTIIGRAMACHPRVLIFDEPTKGIDVRTKVEIYRIMKELAERGVGIILVSSDLNELRKCASRILTMHFGSLSGEFITRQTDNETLVRAILGAGEVRHVA